MAGSTLSWWVFGNYDRWSHSCLHSLLVNMCNLLRSSVSLSLGFLMHVACPEGCNPFWSSLSELMVSLHLRAIQCCPRTPASGSVQRIKQEELWSWPLLCHLCCEVSHMLWCSVEWSLVETMKAESCSHLGIHVRTLLAFSAWMYPSYSLALPPCVSWFPWGMVVTRVLGESLLLGHHLVSGGSV